MVVGRLTPLALDGVPGVSVAVVISFTIVAVSIRYPNPHACLRRSYLTFTTSLEIMQTRLPIDDRPIAEDVKIPDDMLSCLRSDHAGETGAVYIYRGIRAVTRLESLREFARQHQATEERHLEIMSQILPREHRSRLLILWRLAGWLTGAMPALFGARAVYRTIDAVESFVDQHYRLQIDKLRARPQDRELRDILKACRADELLHRDEARGHLRAPGLIGRLWVAVVGAGSRTGVYLASRF